MLRRWLFVSLIVVHGLILALGFTKAFGLTDAPQLVQGISKPWGVAWLGAAGLTLVTAVLFASSCHAWWAVGLGAVALSQVVIASSWEDAKLGTLANALILAGIAYRFASSGPRSFLARYRAAVEKRLAQPMAPPLVTESDLVPLPDPVERYLRQAGVVGQPRVHHFEATWRGRIRRGVGDPWMTFTAEQYNFPGEPARFFLMKATRGGLPVDVYHAFRDRSASMSVKLVSLVPMVDAVGPEMDRAETVTLFNDLCLLAPAELVDPAVRWTPIDERSARANYTIGSNTISAVLSFNEKGELVDFVSDDRLAASADGKQFTPCRWSTPVGEYRSFGPLRVFTRGEARWHPPEGDFAYLEIELVHFEVNAPRREPRART
ncbi:MAG TPA: DUF6544 family protein [Vicinamibacteria bacterium]|nr:DUF6544 family protein [Vicinamibacteria bacterium]